MLRPTSAFLIGVILASAGVAQQPNLRHYTARDGLTQAQVLAVSQDKAGYLWFGNYAGLSRYDGNRFVSVSSDHGLPSNTIRQVLALDDGRILATTAGNHVCFVGGGAAEPAGGDLAPEIDCRVLGEEGSELHDLVVDGATVWAATSQGLLRLADGQVDRFSVADGLPSEHCQAAAIADSWLFVGTDRGLARRRLDSPGRFEIISPFAAADVRALAPSHRGLAVATTGGLAMMTENQLQWAALPPGNFADPLDLTTDAEGMVWLASSTGVIGWHGRQIVRLDASRGLPGDVAHAVFVDRENTLWIGTDFGVTKLVPGPFTTFGTAEGAPNPLVRAVVEDGSGQLWIGTRDGVARWRQEHFEVIETPGVTDPRIFSLLPDGPSGMWIGARSGLILWRDGVQLTVGAEDGLTSVSTMALQREPEKGLWIGTKREIAFRRDDKVEILRHPLLDGISILSMLRRRPGELWLGLESGGVKIIHYSLRTGKVEVERVRLLGAAEGLTDLAIWSMDGDLEGGVWVGSNGAGAYHVDARGVIERLGSGEGLANNFVWQVLCDSGGYVWFFTSHGLYRLGDEGMTYFGHADGLPDLEGMATAALEDSRGHLWFGTSAGIVRYDRAQEVINRVPPVVVIEGLRSQRHGRLATNDAIPRDAGMLTVSFSALSFREESAVRFRYRLEGGQAAAWSEPFADRSLSFANLGPGRYRLHIEAANEAGIWSQDPATIAFEVRPVWWQSGPFYSLCLLALVVLSTAGLRWRTGHLEAERRRLEALVSERAKELRRKNQSLEHQVEQHARTETERQRLEERLRQSEKMQAVGRLAGGVAHDFNNLLTSISGFGELLKDQLDSDDPMQSEVSEILNAAERAARLTQQLLAFSRKQVVEPLLLPLNQVVENISRMLRRLIGEDMDLVLELKARADTVRCDRGQLEQILVNLAVNARDSMIEGGVLTLRTRNDILLNPTFGHLAQEIDAGNYVVLEVEDTGHGIDPEILEHIFEPFFTTKETGKGTGLGLATVYGIVRQNDGFIDVDSEPGRGTRFIVRLPLIHERPSSKNTSGALPIGRVEAQRHTVLVVEDESTVRRLVLGILKKYGYQVLEASSGEQAFEVSRHHPRPIHLLLTDVVMPETGGHLVAEQLTAERPDLRVLYISGYPDDYLGQRGILPTGTNFLNKPFTPKKLILKVRQVLGEEPAD